MLFLIIIIFQFIYFDQLDMSAVGQDQFLVDQDGNPSVASSAQASLA
jgi:hypothetical protein